MTTSEKFTWGIVLELGGSLLLLGGIALSFSLIGACIGIPMVLVGLPLCIWGAVWLFQAQHEKQQEAITAGIREGLATAPTATERGQPGAGGDSFEESQPPVSLPAEED